MSSKTLIFYPLSRHFKTQGKFKIRIQWANILSPAVILILLNMAWRSHGINNADMVRNLRGN